MSETKEQKEGKSWILEVDDEGTITFPEDMLQETGWKDGDVLEWIDNGDQTFSLRKADDDS